MVWIPEGGSAKVRFAFEHLDADFPSKYEEVALSSGMHQLNLRHRNGASTKLSIDGQVVWQRSSTRAWNISSPFENLARHNKILENGPVMLIDALGVATLGADEQYDPDKLRFGLKLWIERITR